MRKMIILAAVTAAITAIAASWATVIIAQAPRNPSAATLSSAVDMVQLMKDAKSRVDENADPVD